MKGPSINERKKLLLSIERLLEGPMIFLGFVWLVLLIVELIWGLSKPLDYLSLTIWLIFIVDFIIKFILAPGKLIFLKENWLTAISLLIPALRIFRVFRFARLLRGIRGIRLVRVVSSINRSMKSLAATMRRRAFGYVFLLTLVVTFAGAAGMYAIEKAYPGFDSYGMALWWTAMRVITAGSEYYPSTPEGRGLAFLIAIFGYAIFGYVTATLATFFIGRDAEEKDAPFAGAKDVAELKNEIAALKKAIDNMISKLG
ncbi:ion transporter [Haliscomenobacter sp.]|uniref:ion transporter n=1 Tax=Haliscomenobacter sp. TaxID=2717303 RepID=UPI003592F38F